MSLVTFAPLVTNESGPPQRSNAATALGNVPKEDIAMHPTIAQATLVVVCYACCGDPKLRPLCKRCTGTGADPTGRAK